MGYCQCIGVYGRWGAGGLIAAVASAAVLLGRHVGGTGGPDRDVDRRPGMDDLRRVPWRGAMVGNPRTERGYVVAAGNGPRVGAIRRRHRCPQRRGGRILV